MKALEAAVRSIEKDGLVWGLSKLVAVGYGVSKLQITVVIEDEKISLDDLQVSQRVFGSDIALVEPQLTMHFADPRMVSLWVCG